MNFIKKEIEANIIGIIDIGSYKIRVAITQYKNKDLDLIGYGEKRQENSFDNESLITIYENINDGIKKAENDGKIDIQDIIINIPFGEIFYEYSKVNYLRKNTSSPIDKKELGEIIEYTKEIALRKAFTNIENNHSYQQNDLKLIITSINKILIDKKETKKLLGENPSEVNITLSNIFIPKNKYRSIQELGNVLKKNIIKIIPSEYSIAHLHFGEKDIVIIDLGSTHTSIIVKINHTIIGMKKLSIGMNDLIKEIQKNQSIFSGENRKTKIEIIDSIDQNIYLKEKEEFLKIFADTLTIALEDILEGELCPHHFFMIGGGSNKFIRKYLEETDLNRNNFKIVKKVSFITPQIEYLNDIDSGKSNLNIYSMMKTALEFIKREKDPIEDYLKQIMSEY